MEQGSVFRPIYAFGLAGKIAVSIPLEQGSVFRHEQMLVPLYKVSLNPFGTGQCLPTMEADHNELWQAVSIPLEQGSVFRLSELTKLENYQVRLNPFGTGQCLPTQKKLKKRKREQSQSLWNRAVSSDCSGILKPCGTRLTRATSQLFPRLRELGLDLIKCCTIFNILFTYQAVENGRDFTRVFRFY